MFKKILIANRGEIACRIAHTARNMGIATVAVYSDADASALHVRHADEAVHIGGAQPAQSYLRIDAIIAAALKSGAEAIHPGYGFLSENPDFVDAVEAAGLIFIGPSSDAIRAMGLKDAAKALMEKAGVPVVPGYHGADQGDETLRNAADVVGYPILIKAVAGGGGKGMRRVDDPKDFDQALASARGEAAAAFGNLDVLIEKYILSPRHIEVQVFGDGLDAIHLFERDCSLQRRHQKVIEEAPAPGMSAEMRLAMGQAAVQAAKTIGYKGAGTVEFIVDGSNGLREDGFWFMEMNTRLQVEHPVTEAITGIDLVEWQLRVAAGQALPATQQDLHVYGHAFEARLYAEDVPAGFLPATGHINHLHFSHFARNDTGVRQGDDISPFYDPMIAKVITHGKTRSEALQKLHVALSQTEIIGVTTNLGFLSALCRHEGFSAGQVDTGLIERDIDLLVGSDQPPIPSILAALLAAYDPTPQPFLGFTQWGGLKQIVSIKRDDQEFSARVKIGSEGAIVEYEGESYDLSRTDGVWTLNGTPIPRARKVGHQVSSFGDSPFHFICPDPLDRKTTSAASQTGVLSPMPGLVKRVTVSAGQSVSEGDALLMLEAMKMEHILRAPRDCIIQEVLCSEEQQVQAGDMLIQFSQSEEGADQI